MKCVAHFVIMNKAVILCQSFFHRKKGGYMKARCLQSAKYAVIFTVGALIYGAVEIAYRGRTHWTMVLCGGACLTVFFVINTIISGDSLWKRCFVGCALITALEFTVGCIVNLWLRWNVWDYSAQFANILGQICPTFCLAWYLLSAPAFKLCDYIGKVGFFRDEKEELRQN